MGERKKIVWKYKIPFERINKQEKSCKKRKEKKSRRGRLLGAHIFWTCRHESTTPAADRDCFSSRTCASCSLPTTPLPTPNLISILSRWWCTSWRVILAFSCSSTRRINSIGPGGWQRERERASFRPWINFNCQVGDKFTLPVSFFRISFFLSSWERG